MSENRRESKSSSVKRSVRESYGGASASLRRSLASFIEFWNAFKRSKAGMTGLALIILLTIIAVAFPVIGNEADIKNWNNQTYLAEKGLPALAPPEWINLISTKKWPITQFIKPTKINVVELRNISKNTTAALEILKYTNPQLYKFLYSYVKSLPKSQWETNPVLVNVRKGLSQTYGDLFRIVVYDIKYDYKADIPPTDIVIRGYQQPPNPMLVQAGILIIILRPDGIAVPLAPIDYKVFGNISESIVTNGTCGAYCGELFKIDEYFKILNAGRSTDASDYYGLVIYDNVPPGSKWSGKWEFRMSNFMSRFTKETRISFITQILKPFMEPFNITYQPGVYYRLDKAIFKKLNPNMLKGQGPSLKGTYHILIIELAAYNQTKGAPDEPPLVVKKAIFQGAYGILGTDRATPNSPYGRDLWQGVLYGTRWALIVGLVASTVSTLIGVIYGVISGYYGGKIDAVMNRLAQIIYSLPVLPILILLSYYMGRSIWNVIMLLIVFGWVGIVFTVRSMALQLRENLYVEAARAIGVDHGRIIMRYIFPQVLPYTFASIALGVPGAILTEAGLSFLGLGDPNVVTWGKILHDAQVSDAVLSGAWWWVVPPGLAIAIVGLSFVLFGYALDTILNPRLRR
jgi:peptide/nickel transport system permease protein